MVRVILEILNFPGHSEISIVFWNGAKGLNVRLRDTRVLSPFPFSLSLGGVYLRGYLRMRDSACLVRRRGRATRKKPPEKLRKKSNFHRVPIGKISAKLISRPF